MAWLNANPMLGTLAGLMILDVLMGLIAAYGAGQLSSSVSRLGAAKKAGTLMVVGVAFLLQPYMGGFPSVPAVVLFFMVTEGLSVLENAARIGIPLPQGLKDALVKVQPGEPKAPQE